MISQVTDRNLHTLAVGNLGEAYIVRATDKFFKPKDVPFIKYLTISPKQPLAVFAVNA